jgi:hypothetical protein
MPKLSKVFDIDGFYQEGCYGVDQESCTNKYHRKPRKVLVGRVLSIPMSLIIVLSFSFFTSSGAKIKIWHINHNSHKEPLNNGNCHRQLQCLLNII